MQHIARKMLVALGLAIGIVVSIAAYARGQEGEQEGGPDRRRLVVTVITRNDRGNVYCAIWNGPQGFPTQRRLAVAQTRDTTIVNRRAHCIFEGLTPNADYAVAAFHDENDNNALDQGLFGIPTEGTGASNDARGFMAPPSYDSARFRLPDAPVHRITINIHY
jgi:uncharacterized protein (DUF2141 family)